MPDTAVELTLANFCAWSGARCSLSPRAGRSLIRFVGNDSRTIGAGDLFVALKTDKDDGHRYVPAALAKGAIAALVSAASYGQFSASIQKKLLVAANPLIALQKAAARYRAELGVLIIGVTGSSGKTTTRSFIMEVLGRHIPVAGTVGNWNNHLGVPMSLLRFTGRELAGVIEMGANHLREIHDLTMIARPDIAVITNIGYAHIGLFGSLAGITRAKFEIVDGLNSASGFMLLNGDDTRLRKEARRRTLRAFYYGFGAGCDLRVGDVAYPNAERTVFTVDNQKFQLAMAGRHFVYAALPAIFCGRRCGMDDRSIARALAEIRPMALRGSIAKKAGVQFMLDCYNANPSSMDMALSLLEAIAPKHARVSVLGDMLELGTYATALHKKLGERLAAAAPRCAVIVGSFADTVAGAAIKKGFPPKSIVTVADAVGAIDALRKVLRRGDTVLLKASRGVKLEQVFEGF